MMECPNCHINAEISEQLYGALYTCDACKAVYFINFNGEPEFSEISDEVLEDIVAEPAPNVQSDAAAGGFESSLEPLIDSVNVVDFDSKIDQQFGVPSEGSVFETSNIESPAMDSLVGSVDENLQSSTEGFSSVDNLSADNLTMDNFNSDFNPFGSVPPAESISVPQPEGSVFGNVAKEISDFGNSDVQLASLNYDLKISGLDTQDLRRLFQEAIEDSRFGWDFNDIMRKIKNGQIEFLQLNPVKAYILAKRLQFLDIEKQWKQNALT